MGESHGGEYRVDLSGGHETYVREYDRFVDSDINIPQSRRDGMKRRFACMSVRDQFRILMLIKDRQDEVESADFAEANAPKGSLGEGGDGLIY